MYLEESIVKAHLAILAVEAARDMTVGTDLEMRFLSQVGAEGIILRKLDRKALMLIGYMPPEVDVVFDLRPGRFLTWVRGAFTALTQDKTRVMRGIGGSPSGATAMIAVLMDEPPMRQAMYDYSWRILQPSIVISLITAELGHLSLQLLMVRPMGRITQSMVAFRDNPEDVSTILPLPVNVGTKSGWRNAKIMQIDLCLASLGAAFAKIDLDLCNCLALAVRQYVSTTLAAPASTATER